MPLNKANLMEFSLEIFDVTHSIYVTNIYHQMLFNVVEVPGV